MRILCLFVVAAFLAFAAPAQGYVCDTQCGENDSCDEGRAWSVAVANATQREGEEIPCVLGPCPNTLCQTRAEPVENNDRFRVWGERCDGTGTMRSGHTQSGWCPDSWFSQSCSALNPLTDVHYNEGSALCLLGCTFTASGASVCTNGVCTGDLSPTGSTCSSSDDGNVGHCDEASNQEGLYCSCHQYANDGAQFQSCLCLEDSSYCPGGPNDPGDGDNGDGGDDGDGDDGDGPGGPGDCEGAHCPDPPEPCDPEDPDCDDNGDNGNGDNGNGGDGEGPGGPGGSPGGAQCDDQPICDEPGSDQCSYLLMQWQLSCTSGEAVSEYDAQQEGLEGDIDNLKQTLFDNPASEIEAPTLDQSGFVSAGCPAQASVSVFDATLEFEFTPFCTLAEILGLLVLISATIASLTIIIRGIN